MKELQLSYILVPLSLIFWYNLPSIREIITTTMICIFIIGTIGELFYRNQSVENKILSILGHFIILFPFIRYKIFNYTKFTNYTFILTLISIYVIFNLPYWPYCMSRKQMTFYLVLTTILSHSMYKNT